jgi:hypothetical protein
MSRPFCTTVIPKIKTVKLQKPTPTNLLERFALLFIKRQSEVKEDRTVIVYKMLFGKRYIVKHFHRPATGYNCRHEVIYQTPKHNY